MLTVFALNFHDAADEQQVAKEELDKEIFKEQKAKEAAERERLAAEQAKADALAAQEAARLAEDKARVAEARAAEQATQNRHLHTLLDQAVAQLEHELHDRELARDRLLGSLEKSLRDRNIRVSLDTRSGILRLSGDLLFETGQSDLKPEARRTVAVLAEVLSRVLGCYTDGGKRDGCEAGSQPILESVLVEGHTDKQPYNKLTPAQSLERNDQLSTDRALTVFKELRLDQPALDLLLNGNQQPLMAFSGYGQRRPLSDAQGLIEADYQRNRRIDLRFVLSARTSDEFNRLREQIRQELERP
jgi:flagellar motor protein MotB